MTPGAGQGGQASVELVAATLALAICGLAAFHVLAAGHTNAVADNAAEAAAIALVNGGDPRAAAHAAAPGWRREDVRVGTRGSRVTVTLPVPAALRALRGRLTVTARAAARPPQTGAAP